MYNNNKVRLIIGKIDTSIPFQVGIRQGDSVSPLLFLFLMMTFAETVKAEWEKNSTQKIEFKRQRYPPQYTGQITSYPAKNISQGTLFNIFCMLYVDNGAFVFTSRVDIDTGSYLVYKKNSQFGLQMHIGTSDKTSKTECFFPHPGPFQTTHPSPAYHSPMDPSHLPVTPKLRQENEEQKRKRYDRLYDEA